MATIDARSQGLLTFWREPRCRAKCRQARRGSFPCQDPQRRMAAFAAQPEGTGSVWRSTASLVVHLE
ncbi:hypothetical protein FCG41_08550 [Azotobacter chroococcum]|nr:hypothetical protein FCG41_08550 [Azotobacter chroococcum]